LSFLASSSAAPNWADDFEKAHEVLLASWVAWHRLRPEQAQRATIRVIGGPLHTAAEITAASLWTFSKCLAVLRNLGGAECHIVRPLR